MTTVYFRDTSDPHLAAMSLVRSLQQADVVSAQLRVYRGATQTRFHDLVGQDTDALALQFQTELAEAERQASRPIAYLYRKNEEVDFLDMVSAARETVVSYSGCCVVALSLNKFTDGSPQRGALFLFFADFADGERWREAHEGKGFDLSDHIGPGEAK